MFSRLPGVPLPIFKNFGLLASYYYTPGYLVKVANDRIIDFEIAIHNSCTLPNNGQRNPSAEALINAAQLAERKFEKLVHSIFEPLCLTIYLNQACTLDCQYCFSDLNNNNNGERISSVALRSAVTLVAKSCKKNMQPLTIVFHGGGEPILSWKVIERIQPFLKEQSEKNGIHLFRYLSTNGIMTEERAYWLANTVERVSLSCDGPPRIQIEQRPLRKSTPQNSAFYIERTAKILHQIGVPLTIRVTLTKNTFEEQEEICEYICRRLCPQSIHVEPVYLGGKAKNDSIIHEENIESFIKSFTAAKNLANNYGIDWVMSGMRINEIHMAYCNIFRQVLQYIPGDTASVCFKTINTRQSIAEGFDIGWYDVKNDRFALKTERINRLRNDYQPSIECQNCFIKYHCTHKCPNGCPVKGINGFDFLCKLYQKMAFEELSRFMEQLNQYPEPISGMEI